VPTYDYVCRGCGHALEITHSIHAPARKTCPACGARKLERRIGGAAFQFKGSGFYKTDYRKAATPAEPAGEPAAKPASGAPAATPAPGAGTPAPGAATPAPASPAQPASPAKPARKKPADDGR